MISIKYLSLAAFAVSLCHVISQVTCQNIASVAVSNQQNTSLPTSGPISSVPAPSIQQNASLPAPSLISPTPPPSNLTSLVGISDEVKRFEEFKRSNYYVPLYDSEVLSFPKVQQEFVVETAGGDLDLFRTILKEAIEKKNNFAPSVSLMWKYSGKLLGNAISHRRAELRLPARIEPKSSFFNSVAVLGEKIIDLSTKVKKEKGYTKKTVDTDDLYKRADAMFNYIYGVIKASPVGYYLKWEEMILFKGEPGQKNLMEESADVAAQFRGLGYEGCMFVVRRIINLMRMFSRGTIPSLKEVR